MNMLVSICRVGIALFIGLMVFKESLIHVEYGFILSLIPGKLGRSQLLWLLLRGWSLIIHLFVTIVGIGEHFIYGVCSRNISLKLPLLFFFDCAFSSEQSISYERNQGSFACRVATLDSNYALGLETLRQSLLLGGIQSETRIRESIAISEREIGFSLVDRVTKVQKLGMQIAYLELIIADIAAIKVLQTAHL